MTDELKIIKLRPEQWQQYKELRLRALKEEPQAFGSSYEENVNRPDSYWKERLNDVINGKGSLVFAELNNELVGMIGSFHKDDDPLDVINIIAVHVVKEARGRGIAKKLMEKIIKNIITDNSITKLKLAVNKNQLPAVKLYESFGFKVVGTENAKLGDGNYYDELLMEKNIAAQNI